MGGEKCERILFQFFSFFQWKMLNLCLNEWEKLFLLQKWVTKLTFYGFEDMWLDLFISFKAVKESLITHFCRNNGFSHSFRHNLTYSIQKI